MRIAYAQINSVLGDFEGNGEKIITRTIEAKNKKAKLIVFPECSLFGYQPNDLLEFEFLYLQQEKSLKSLHKKIPSGIKVLVGAITRSKVKHRYLNSAVLLEKGKKQKVFSKSLLAVGDVFDESRFFDEGDLSGNYFDLDGKTILVSICEDIWAWDHQRKRNYHPHNPFLKLKNKKIDLNINISASPWFVGKEKLREKVIKSTIKKTKAPLLYVNLVGGQDELIFDGRSYFFDKNGKKLNEAHTFEEQLCVVDLSNFEFWSPSFSSSEMSDLKNALVMGIRDYCLKNGFEKAHLGLSGGIDSALVACLAADALGPQNVKLIAMPGPYSSDESLTLARSMAKNLGTELLEIPINDVYQSVLTTITDPLELKSFGLVNENIQARLRGLFLMSFSNTKRSLLLSTSNKTEYAVGYATLYGDMCGGLAPIGDLTKQQVYSLSKFYNQEIELIPKRVIERPPTAELRENQKDQDTLPPYDELDKAVEDIVVKQKTPKTKTEKWLVTALKNSEFKRWQAPPILKVSEHAFGRGRRFPIAGRWK